MPKPLPDYTPPEIAAEIERLRRSGIPLSGLTGFAEYKGLSRNRLNHLFGSKRHPQLRTYYDLSRFADVSMDELMAVIRNQDFSAWVDRLLWSRQIANVAEFERQVGLGRDAIRQRLNGYDSWSALEDYADVAEKLGWSLEKLSQWIFDGAVYTNAS